MVVLDCDVASSCKTRDFGEAYPDRFLDCGVAEANMVDLAADFGRIVNIRRAPGGGIPAAAD